MQHTGVSGLVRAMMVRGGWDVGRQPVWGLFRAVFVREPEECDVLLVRQVQCPLGGGLPMMAGRAVMPEALCSISARLLARSTSWS